MRRHWKRALQMALGLGLAAGLLWLFFRRTDWAEAWDATTEASLGLLALTVLTSLASLALRALRWQILLRPVKRGVPFLRAWRYFLVGFAVSSVLPGRLGEVIRPYLLARDQGIRFAPTFATVVTDRVIDLSAVLCLLASMYVAPAVLGPIHGLGPDLGDPEVVEHVALIEWVGLVALCAAAAGAAFLVVLGLWTERTLALLGWVLRPLPRRFGRRIHEVAASFAEGVAGLGDLRALAAVLGITVVTWLVLALGMWTGLAAFDLIVPPAHAVFLIAVIALGVALPTPGGSGTYHAGVMVVVGQLWGLGQEAGGAVAAFAIVGHLSAYLPVVLLGGYYLVRDGIHVMRVAEEAGVHAEEGSEEP